MYIVLAILAFEVLILVHELGHFLTARLFGVKVNEFALGMGPKLLKKQGKETLFTVRAIPIGGFCAMEGEDGDSEDPRAFTSRPAWQRAIILCAGAAMNFLFGFLLVLCIAPQASFTEPVISGFMPDCPYEGENALQTGDQIWSIDGHRIYFTNNVSEYLQRSGTEEHDLVLLRDGGRVKLEDFRLTLRSYTLEDGSQVQRYGLYFAPRQQGLWANVKYAWYECLDFVRLVWHSLGDLVSGAVGLRELSGAVGIVDYVNTTAQQARSFAEAAFDFAFIFALIAVNLAVMNLLPLPALDGGRIFLLLITALIEAVTRKKLNPKYEGYVHAAGLVLLMGLMVLVLFNDVVKIIAR